MWGVKLDVEEREEGSKIMCRVLVRGNGTFKGWGADTVPIVSGI